MGTDAVPALSKSEKIRMYGEVFTPLNIVREMCDSLELESPGAFEPGTTYLEPCCGDGAFVLEILRRKFARCKRRSDYTTALRSVYAMEIQADNVDACIANVNAMVREYITPTKAEFEIIRDHIIQADSLKVMRMINEMNERMTE